MPVGATVCASRLATAQQLLTLSTGVSLVQADYGITTNAYLYMQNLVEAMQSATPLTVQFPANNSLAAQLQQIAQIIQENGGKNKLYLDNEGLGLNVNSSGDENK